jgi:hypothetical protein
MLTLIVRSEEENVASFLPLHMLSETKEFRHRMTTGRCWDRDTGWCMPIVDIFDEGHLRICLDPFLNEKELQLGSLNRCNHGPYKLNLGNREIRPAPQRDLMSDKLICEIKEGCSPGKTVSLYQELSNFSWTVEALYPTGE